MALIRKFSTLVAVFLLVSILPSEALESQKFVKIYFPDGDSVSAELAVSSEERARGLMFRTRMEFDQGMLFVFGKEGFYSFWMKNMVFALDFIWLDGEKRIVHIEENVPPCIQEPCPSYTSKVPARYFLELKAGSVAKRKLRILDRLDFVLPESN